MRGAAIDRDRPVIFVGSLLWLWRSSAKSEKNISDSCLTPGYTSLRHCGRWCRRPGYWSVHIGHWSMQMNHSTAVDGQLSLLARDAFVIMNRRAIAMTFVCPSVCLSGTGVILWCTFARILVYGWIVQCSGHPDTKACPPTPSRLFPIPPGREVRYGCARRDISRTVEDRDLSYYWVLIGSHICRVDWHNNLEWPWMAVSLFVSAIFRIARYLCGSCASCWTSPDVLHHGKD